MSLQMITRYPKEVRCWLRRGLLVLFAAEELMPELSTEHQLPRRPLVESGYLAGYTQQEQAMIFGWLLNQGLLQLISSEAYCLKAAGIALLCAALDEIAARRDQSLVSPSPAPEAREGGRPAVMTCTYCGDDVSTGMPRDRGVPCCRRCHVFICQVKEQDLLRGILLALFGTGMFGSAVRARATQLHEFYRQLPAVPQAGEETTWRLARSKDYGSH